ncbi:hypothetical protein SDJN03_00959, partial [Cucurbita argyrosperma subsp. sororia]
MGSEVKEDDERTKLASDSSKRGREEEETLSWDTKKESKKSKKMWKSEAVHKWYGKMFRMYFKHLKMDMSCIQPNLLQTLRKDWEDMLTAKHEYQLKNAKLLVEISDIRRSQNI